MSNQTKVFLTVALIAAQQQVWWAVHDHYGVPLGIVAPVFLVCCFFTGYWVGARP